MVQKNDRVVTVFGGGGFVGRYVAQALHRHRVRVRIAQRDPRRAFFLKPLGGLGMTQFVRADVTDAASVRAAVQGSDAVINLVGILKGNFEAVHVTGARNVAEAAAEAGADALVHVSAIGADAASESRYGSSKGVGEGMVRQAFPGATIIRPSVVFGMEDNFVNRFARMARLLPFIPVLRGGVKLQPVWAADLGRAIAAAALDPRTHGGQTYELGGPQAISMRDLNGWICHATGRGTKPVAEIPDVAGRLLARTSGWVPGAPITWDQWLMLQQDNVASPDLPGFEAFGISPAPLAAVTEGWLTHYRRQGRFAQSPY
ncbi:MAG: complex I NDUFA9 subunit family protein [Allosphingosinicella sp.]|uniref:complex I NDUFA9 subunit family protein n=1 Tax=Allosphingosinicella sp. TaxID=2823234 RepID=UPI00394CC067